MNVQADIPSLASLEHFPYIDAAGKLPHIFQGKVGIYAIFDQQDALQYVGYSRDVFLSLKQHLVRRPEYCYGVKVQTIDRPNRTILENTRNAWIAENGAVPIGNSDDTAIWNEPIQVEGLMTPEEQEKLANPLLDDVMRTKAVKNVARRIEAGIMEQIKARGVQEEIRFQPKLKEQGLLDLK
ncbi:GIY-YIG nuclease family protein [filamentous cyanobacterium LEGE 11480]|uniref:GIY-YIG nuclease family protein n=1 Tax=Romeriopsis navalis LEGE 11480 TaxID=2777977 RepID=A0A928Z491_9CYAN|nr:GIY-YIG nuclease family protein [Romeriopsis navalis]MBE9030020.1 GIY-YIG nuclease family protein [Romeriopsis navalis LEGE 11480]